MSKKVGILGDGQLARMLAQSHQAADVSPVIFASNEKNPAAKLGLPVVLGSASRMDDLQKLFINTKTIIFENEFLDCALLARSAQATLVHFVPSLDNIFLFQDKLKQKEKLKSLSIPSADYLILTPKDDVTIWIGDAFEKFGSCVFKWSRLGYDGKGVFISRDKSRDLTELLEFIENGKKSGGEIYVEKLISFRRELAIVACHSTKGEFASYPLVISRQENGICRQVLGPATSFGVNSKLETQAQTAAKSLAESCKLYGCFAIEFFETEQGELLVNEIAPRVHNTGHYTMDASECSQFENHLRAVTGQKLGSTSSAPAFFMWNILGPNDIGAIQDTPERRPQFKSPAILHWYEKEEIRSRRKLGHVNVKAPSPEQIQDQINEILKADREWTLSLKSV